MQIKLPQVVKGEEILRCENLDKRNKVSENPIEKLGIQEQNIS